MHLKFCNVLVLVIQESLGWAMAADGQRNDERLVLLASSGAPKDGYRTESELPVRRVRTHPEPTITVDVSGGRVALADYFETHTHIYNVINESPHKKLYEQMIPDALAFIRSNQSLVFEFEIAAEDFKELTGPGLSSALFPSTLQAYKRLGERLHPIALERYGDLLGYAAQVKMEKDLICEMLWLCCSKCETEGLLSEAEEAYKKALDAYIVGSDHAKFLRSKITDLSDIKKRIGGKYCCRIAGVWAPMIVTAVGVSVYYAIVQTEKPSEKSTPTPSPYVPPNLL
jgi:hypothetical protein